MPRDVMTCFYDRLRMYLSAITTFEKLRLRNALFSQTHALHLNDRPGKIKGHCRTMPRHRARRDCLRQVAGLLGFGGREKVLQQHGNHNLQIIAWIRARITTR